MENETEKRLAEINVYDIEDWSEGVRDQVLWLIAQVRTQAERIRELELSREALFAAAKAHQERAKKAEAEVAAFEKREVEYHDVTNRLEAEVAYLRDHMKNITRIENERDRALAELTRLSKFDDNKDALCFYCGKKTESFAADPGLWPLFFVQPDKTGICRTHHTRCVIERLRVAADKEAVIEAAEAYRQAIEDHAIDVCQCFGGGYIPRPACKGDCGPKNARSLLDALSALESKTDSQENGR